jgi:hypothetical protein
MAGSDQFRGSPILRAERDSRWWPPIASRFVEPFLLAPQNAQVFFKGRGDRDERRALAVEFCGQKLFRTPNRVWLPKSLKAPQHDAMPRSNVRRIPWLEGIASVDHGTVLRAVHYGFQIFELGVFRQAP